MSNHLHFVVATQQEPLENIIRDLKKYTSPTLLKAIETHPQESRKAWMLWMFQRTGQRNGNNQHYPVLATTQPTAVPFYYAV